MSSKYKLITRLQAVCYHCGKELPYVIRSYDKRKYIHPACVEDIFKQKDGKHG